MPSRADAQLGRAAGDDVTAVLRRVRPEQFRELVLLLVIVVLVAVLRHPRSRTTCPPRTFTRLTTGLAIIAVVAVGQVLVVLTRNIDLSVGSIVGLVAYAWASLLTAHAGLNPLRRRARDAASGCGRWAPSTALIVAYGRVPSIIATLGTLALYPRRARRVLGRARP